MTSTRRQIIEVFRDRLSVIRKSGGYLTNAGKLIFLGEQPNLGPDDPDDAIAIGVEEDVPSQGQGLGGGGLAAAPKPAIELQFTVSFHALVKASIDEPLIAQENVIHDIKRAVELPDRTLGGLVGGLRRGPTVPLHREEGTTVVGAAVQYAMVYSEIWGDPEA